MELETGVEAAYVQPWVVRVTGDEMSKTAATVLQVRGVEVVKDQEEAWKGTWAVFVRTARTSLRQTADHDWSFPGGSLRRQGTARRQRRCLRVRQRPMQQDKRGRRSASSHLVRHLLGPPYDELLITILPSIAPWSTFSRIRPPRPPLPRFSKRALSIGTSPLTLPRLPHLFR